MSNGVVVNVAYLHRIFEVLRVLIPKGDSEMPLGIHVSKGEIVFTCTQGCLYKSTIPINDVDFVSSTTVLYRDILPLLNSSGELLIEFNPTFVSISGDGFEVSLPSAFSVIEDVDLSKAVYKELTSSLFLNGIKSIVDIGLEKIYGKSSPITVYNEIAIQKYPNVWVQTRANGMPANVMIDAMYLRLLLRLNPTHVSSDITGTLVFKSKQSLLQIPCKAVVDKVMITTLLNGMESCIKISIGSYTDRLRNIAKFGTSDYCKVYIYEEGLGTSLSNNNVTLKVTRGNCQSPVVGAFEIPIQLWLAILKGGGSEVIEILYGGDKVCLRTPFTIIVTHVLR